MWCGLARNMRCGCAYCIEVGRTLTSLRVCLVSGLCESDLYVCQLRRKKTHLELSIRHSQSGTIIESGGLVKKEHHQRENIHLHRETEEKARQPETKLGANEKVHFTSTSLS
jgi:hypothetical protein